MSHAVEAMACALERQIKNVERWMETGVPAGPEESEDIYQEMVSALASYRRLSGDAAKSAEDARAV